MANQMHDGTCRLPSTNAWLTFAITRAWVAQLTGNNMHRLAPELVAQRIKISAQDDPFLIWLGNTVVVLAPSVAAFYIMWPAQVLQGTNRSVQWHDGVPPYELDVDSLYPTKRLYTYVGDDWVVYWVIDVLPGTVIRYSVTDSAGEQSNSSELTIQPNPILTTASLMSISVVIGFCVFSQRNFHQFYWYSNLHPLKPIIHTV
ncbi:uncharacterized protein EI90DRAFT_2371270 [Cantharellus anzutake]|uniref:uncharacterized protein n=1 Tax=Cantharellus anzutake TaxID=1750568 RepID=UPI001906B7E4|nr:uncharacterized protein EI90DRAFT_2371270 [Cantharellus anzutake]KAF8324226.1 hypothetical protein EI90DRAFT_2371270 [Cantharellus anzutake]